MKSQSFSPVFFSELILGLVFSPSRWQKTPKNQWLTYNKNVLWSCKSLAKKSCETLILNQKSCLRDFETNWNVYTHYVHVYFLYSRIKCCTHLHTYLDFFITRSKWTFQAVFHMHQQLPLSHDFGVCKVNKLSSRICIF